MSAESSRLPMSGDLETADAVGAPLRFVTAASLFDGHDAAINLIRRLLQSEGAEVVHLGHNRSVADIVRAAIDEDADGIAVSSYQGGHNSKSQASFRLRSNPPPDCSQSERRQKVDSWEMKFRAARPFSGSVSPARKSARVTPGNWSAR